jgi:spore coat protein CotH
MHHLRLASFTTLLASSLILTTPAAAQTSDDLFDPTVLHDIQLTMKPGDWENLQANYLSDTYYPADMKWREVVVSQVGVRSRGSGSRNPKKPGLKVDFGQYLDQTAFGLKSIVLANAIQDPSMLAQRVGLGMFARMGMPASRVVHARVFVNGDYLGLYELIEPVDKTFLARVFGQDANGKSENGGYLYEYHWKSDYPWDYLGPDLRLYAELFEPKTHEGDAPVPLYGPLETLFRRLNQTSDSQFEREVGELLDLRQFVRHIAVENFIAERDGFLGNWGPNNFYLYRFQGRTVSQLLPWDKDLALWAKDYDILQGVNDNVLTTRLLAIPAYFRLYLETLIECADASMRPESEESSMGWLEAEMVRITTQIRDAARADRNTRFDNERFDEETRKVLRFARERGPFVAHEARYALGQMSLALAQMSWPGVSSKVLPRYISFDFRQNDHGLSLGSLSARGMWR